MWLALLAVLVAADPVPVAGRPKDFSGAVGGPFVVTTTAEPTTVRVGEPINFTIHIIGPGDLSNVQRFALDNNPDFAAFTVEDGPERELNIGREYDYIVRARSTIAKAIPRVKFTYFNPAIRPAELGFQTTYSEPVHVTIVPPMNGHGNEVPKELRAGIEENHRVCDRVSRYWQYEPTHSWMLPALWLAPPLVCVAWYLIAPPTNPLETARRHALRRLQNNLANPPAEVAQIVREFIGASIGQKLANVTSVELTEIVIRTEMAPEMIKQTSLLLEGCERAQFGGGSTIGLVANARAVIRGWKVHP